MKFILLALLSLNLLWTVPVAAGPGGGTTPFPFGLSPEDLVGRWSNPVHGATLTIEHIRAAKGQSEKLFVVINDNRSVSTGYLYFATNQYCGIMYHNDGRSSPLCLRGRFGLLTVEANQNRFYFSNHQRLAGR
jgi:hypothetical protein